jgi:hypothetical protein
VSEECFAFSPEPRGDTTHKTILVNHINYFGLRVSNMSAYTFFFNMVSQVDDDILNHVAHFFFFFFLFIWTMRL